MYTFSPNNPPPTSTDSAPKVAGEGAEQGEQPDGLIWPQCIAEPQKAAIRAKLADLPTQLILDELEGATRKGSIKFPVRYLEHLSKKAAAGEFIPDAGLEVAAGRERERQRRAARAHAEQVMVEQVKRPPPPEVAAMLGRFGHRPAAAVATGG